MENLVDVISEKAGLAGTPLTKIPLKDKKRLKAGLAALQQKPHDIAHEVLLRAYLLSGEKPNAKIKSAEIIANALTLKDVLRNANKLTDHTLIADGENLFAAIKLIIKMSGKAGLNQTTIKAVIGYTQKWWEKAVLTKSKLTDKTEDSIIALINELYLRIDPPKNLDDKVIRKFRLFLYPMFKILLGVAAQSSSSQTPRLSYRTVVKMAKKFPSSIVNNILTDESLSNDLETFKQTMLKSVETVVLNGDLEQLRELNGMIDETLNMRALFIEKIRTFWDCSGATFNREIQLFIRTIVFDEPVRHKSFELTKENEQSNINQLASALISSWVARNDGPLALDSFRLLSSVAEKFFNLKIVGDVDAIVNFNKFAHEAVGNAVLSENAKVQIVRPWVEWNGEERKVLIKALVKSLQ
jgi:hypothetical protein